MTTSPDSQPPSPEELSAALSVPHDALQRLADRVKDIMARIGEPTDAAHRPAKRWTGEGAPRRLGALERQMTSRR
jgi:hypothetical protein